MIKKIKTYTELLNEIDLDSRSNNINAPRFPIRLLILNTFKELNKLIHDLNKQDIKLLELKDLLPHEDGWITPSEIVEFAKKQKEKTIIVSLSEILRFYSKENCCSLLLSLAEIENLNNANRRVYIPIVGLLERFGKEFLKQFSRKEEWAPIWKLDENNKLTIKDNIKIYILNFKIPSNIKLNIINNTKEMLDIWNNKNDNKFFSTSNSISNIYENFLPDRVFDCIVINNPKDFLEKIYDFDTDIDFLDNDFNYWINLINIVSENKGLSTLKELLELNFNIKEFYNLNCSNIIKRCVVDDNEFNIWLIKCWINKNEALSDTYLNIVFKNLEIYNKSGLIKSLWVQIFNIEKPKKLLFEERRSYLELLHKELNESYNFINNEIEKEIINLFEKNEDLYANLDYLTDITLIERNYIINLIKENYIDKKIKIIELIEKSYRNLYFYLKEFTPRPKEEWINKYFLEYKWSKLLDKKSKCLNSYINDKNKDKRTFYNWYYSINNISEEDLKATDSYKILFIDGLGLEWLGLVTELIKLHGNKNNIYIEDILIRRANIPTITECNKIIDAKIIPDLDKYIHNEKPYRNPYDLINEIELLDRIIRENIINRNWSKMSIVADHGFTVFAQKKFGCRKKYDFKDSNHEGRCMWIEKEIPDDDDFIIHKVDMGPCKNKNSLVALKHNVLYKSPSRETHGGVTPEEVLVPILKLYRDKIDISYEIILIKKEISVKDPKIEFKISPTPEITPVLIYKNTEIGLKKEHKYWYCQLKKPTTGKHNILLKISSYEYSTTINIRGGLKDRDLI